MATKGELPQILAILRDRSQYVSEDESRGYSPRHALVEAIPRLMGRDSLALWRELLSDPEDRVRASAIAGLCRLQDLASLPRLREAAAEITHVGMRKKVAAALRKLEQTGSS
jgi:HEAT repeat protein